MPWGTAQSGGDRYGQAVAMGFGRSCERPYRSAEMGMIRDVAQFGSALGSGPRGRWFKSSRPDQKSQVRGKKSLTFFFTHASS